MPLDNPLVFDIIFRNAESTSILIFDPSGKIVDFNRAFKNLLGYSKESLIGKNVSALFSRNDLKANIPGRVMKKAMEIGVSHDDIFLRHHNGSPVWIHGECIMAKDRSGQKLFVNIIHDLSKERLLEQELKDKNREQEKIISDHETFIYTTSHDLRSPLNNLEGLLQNVEESHNDPDTIAYLVPLINESIARLKKKINELSVIGKLKEEENKRPSKVRFYSLYHEVLEDLEKEILASNADLSADFSEAPVIKFSKSNLRSLLHNLISNSIKYRSPNRKPTISVKTEVADDEFILLTVKDNGLGIGEEERERIFEMYHRLHLHIEGTGVGLGIVKKIVENAGGKVEVDSQMGEGSLFKIYLKAEKVLTEAD